MHATIEEFEHCVLNFTVEVYWTFKAFQSFCMALIILSCTGFYCNSTGDGGDGVRVLLSLQVFFLHCWLVLCSFLWLWPSSTCSSQPLTTLPSIDLPLILLQYIFCSEIGWSSNRMVLKKRVSVKKSVQGRRQEEREREEEGALWNKPICGAELVWCSVICRGSVDCSIYSHCHLDVGELYDTWFWWGQPHHQHQQT